MSDTAVETGTETPAKAPRRKAPSKPAGAAKPKKATKAAPKAKKAASKPAKAPAKARAKARVSNTANLDDFGYRKGSLKSQAAAMYASKKGATMAEVYAKLESNQLNLLTDLEGKGHKVKRVKEDGDGPRQVTRYFLSA